MAFSEDDHVTAEEFREALKIAREDGLHVHKTYARFQASLKTDEPPAPEKDKKSKEGDPPPVKEPPEEKPPRDFWFGTRGN